MKILSSKLNSHFTEKVSLMRRRERRKVKFIVDTSGKTAESTDRFLLSATPSWTSPKGQVWRRKRSECHAQLTIIVFRKSSIYGRCKIGEEKMLDLRILQRCFLARHDVQETKWQSLLAGGPVFEKWKENCLEINEEWWVEIIDWYLGRRCLCKATIKINVLFHMLQ